EAAGFPGFLAAPPAEMPDAFQRMVEGVLDSFGGVVARVGDTIEARLDALGDGDGGTDARIIVEIPTLPSFRSRVVVEAALPPGPPFSIAKRSLVVLDALTTTWSIDTAYTVRGDPRAPPHVSALALPLSSLAAVAPEIDAGD